jgi:hypothetical protein
MDLNPATNLRLKIEQVATDQKKAYEGLIEIHSMVVKIEESIENE